MIALWSINDVSATLWSINDVSATLWSINDVTAVAEIAVASNTGRQIFFSLISIYEVI